ncbi:MAG TPA: hypothetical protein VIP79_00125, partial [Gemmatimonadaceae bacterium]
MESLLTGRAMPPGAAAALGAVESGAVESGAAESRVAERYATQREDPSGIRNDFTPVITDTSPSAVRRIPSEDLGRSAAFFFSRLAFSNSARLGS